VVCPVQAGQQQARDPESRLAEAVGLARAIELDVVRRELVTLRQRVPATLLGSGKVEEIGRGLEAEPAELVVVDAPLTPVQQRNLEKRWKAKVIDRTGLILEIFGERARTREGVLQVELAALTYQRSRLVRSWTHLERQRGGFGFAGGPGETQLELDRRKISERIVRIKEELAEVRRTRGLHREARKRVPYPIIALVGYTNAGKSTLFNRLTGASVVARDQLFATLDPTMRRIGLPSGTTAILSDTVGFITELPTMLVAAFRATLEEVLEADLIVHVRDISHPDAAAQRTDVEGVLDGLGVGEPERRARMVEAWNKIDLLAPERLEELEGEAARRNDDVVLVAAVDGAGLDRLLELADRRLQSSREVVELRLDYADGEILAWLHSHGDVLEQTDDGEGLRVRASLSASERARVARRLEERHGRQGGPG
jgi:GTP-binding protein HflX